jgi:hypothetical protein
MKKIICFSLITLVYISSFAQEIPFKIQKSEVFKDEYKESQIVLSEEDGNGGILIVRSYNGKGIFANRGFYFERYGLNLNLAKEFDFQIEHPTSHKYATALGVVKTETVVRVIEMYYDINEKSYICIANSINKNDFKLERTVLFKLTRDELKKYGSFSLNDICYDKNDKKLSSETNGYFSDTSSGIALIANENSFSIAIDFMSNDSTEALKLFLFDNQLTKKIDRVFIKKVEDRKYIFQNIDLSKDGNSLYLLAKSSSKEAKSKAEGGKYQFELTKFIGEKELSKTFEIGEKFVGSLKSIFLKDKLVCIGFYSDIKDKFFGGISYFEIDPNTLEERLSKFSPFTDQFLMDKYGKVKDKELKSLKFKNILITSENEIILNAEECYTTSSGGSYGVGMGGGTTAGMNYGGMNYGGMNYGGMSGGMYFGGIYEHTYNHFDDIVSIKVNAKGDLIWARNINKKQIGSSSLASYTSVLDETNEVFFFFNAKEKIKEISNNRIQFKGIGNVNLIRINQKGDFEYQKILDDDENEVPFMVSNGIKSGNSVFFLGRKGSTKQLLKVSL